MAEVVPSKVDSEWRVVVIPSLAGGLDTTTSPELLPAGQSPNVSNLSLREGKVRVDPGYVLFGGNNTGNGNLRTTAVWENGGAQTILGITDETVLRLTTYDIGDESFREWQYVPPEESIYSGVVHTTIGSSDSRTALVVVGTDFVVDGDSPTAAGMKIGVILDTGAQHQDIINSSVVDGAVTLVQLTTGLPAGATVTAGNSITVGKTLDGSREKHVSVVSVPWGDPTAGIPWTVFTNGVDVPYYYEGNKLYKVPNLPYATNVKCQTVATFKGTLILANCTLGGDSKPNTILWSDIGDPTEWTSDNAGQQDILEEGSEISAMKSLGPDMIVYGPRSITRMSYAGSVNYLFAFMGAVAGSSIGTSVIGEGFGCVSNQAIFSTGDSHVFMAPNGIYQYTGGYSAKLISGPVNQRYFDVGGLIDSSNMHRTFTAYLSEFRELYFFIPTRGEEYSYDALVLDIQSLSAGSSSATFSARSFPTPMCGSGVAFSQKASTWASADGPWSDWAIPWNAEVLASDAPTVTLGTDSLAPVHTPVMTILYVGDGANISPRQTLGSFDHTIDFQVGDEVVLTLNNGTTTQQTITSVTQPTAPATLGSFKVGSPEDSSTWDTKISFTSIIARLSRAGGFGIYNIDYRSFADAIDPGNLFTGYGIDWSIETKDFTGFEKELRTDFIDMALHGVSVTISVSRDGGQNFTDMKTITAGSIKSRTRVHAQGVSDTFRYRIAGTGGGGELGPLAIRYREEDRYRLT